MVRKILVLFLSLLIGIVLFSYGVQENEHTIELNTRQTDIAIPMESLAGEWIWADGLGNPIVVNADGTWEHVPGDHGVRGTVELTQDGGDFIVDLVATEGQGPGIQGSYNPETGYHYWISHPSPSEGSFTGTYSMDSDKLVIQSPFGDSLFIMERNR